MALGRRRGRSVLHPRSRGPGEGGGLHGDARSRRGRRGSRRDRGGVLVPGRVPGVGSRLRLAEVARQTPLFSRTAAHRPTQML
ncbi:MAG: hypothetical protein F4X59_10370 [Holophagales bacterium]|nr:hypothetical protein [Holophagales bacterium]MYC10522.1 hypothetical protein [Holophagales bacterium]